MALTEQEQRSLKNNTSKSHTASKYTILEYPSTLHATAKDVDGSLISTHAAMLSFTAYKDFHVTSVDRTALFSQNIKNDVRRQHITGSVNLPMLPVSREYSHDYSQDESGLISKMIQSYTKEGGWEGNGISAALGAAANSLAGETISEELHDHFGIIINKNIFSRYNGTKIRGQELSYTLTARNPDELRTIGSIIEFFKLHSAATTTDLSNKVQSDFTTAGMEKSISKFISSNKLSIPNIWTIEEVTLRPGERFIRPFKFGPAFLETVKYDIGGNDEFPLLFKSGDPVVINLSLSFIETMPLYGEDIQGLGF